jgi:RND superfamily putative drug exporter
MRPIFSPAGLARASANHPWRAVGLWVVILIVAGLLASRSGNVLDGREGFTNEPESRQGLMLIEEHMGAKLLQEQIVFHSDLLTVDDAAYQVAVEQTLVELLAMDDVVSSASNYYQRRAASDASAEQLVSQDRHSTFIPVTLTATYDTFSDIAGRGEDFITTAEAQRSAELEVYAVGDLSRTEVYNNITEEDVSKDMQIGLPVAGLVLIVVFGALVAAGLPILLGLISIVVATGLTAALANVLDVTNEVTSMITMIGLAVGIDYALFVVERFREERRHGLPKVEAIQIAGGTAGKAVLFSGGTVVLALMGMFLIPITVFHSLAAGAILAVLVAVLATQTFVPAILMLLGDRINWPRRRKYDDPASIAAQQRYDAETIHRGFWGRVTQLVMRRPVATLVIAVGLLVVLALPAFTLRTGQPGIESLPESNIKSGYEILDRQFYAGVIAPVDIVVEGSVDDPQVREGIDLLIAELGRNELYGPATVVTSPTSELSVISVPMAIDPNSERAYDQIDALRDDVVPATFGDLADDVYVSGNTAFMADFNAIMGDYAPIVYAFVLGLSFLLLMVAFRSIVVPIKAILMNLLSVGAAYGAVVAVFQHGIGADLLGLRQTENIAAWLPVFLFSVLFGLSMDYHVFLLSRIREHFDITHNSDEAVAVGLQATGKIITGAALIMVAVFGAFATGRIVDIQQMGFGLAVAVFLDATIVRSLLVPASMKLLGDRNWYLPHRLGWLPDLRIEGQSAHVPAGVQAGAGDD